MLPLLVLLSFLTGSAQAQTWTLITAADTGGTVAPPWPASTGGTTLLPTNNSAYPIAAYPSANYKFACWYGPSVAQVANVTNSSTLINKGAFTLIYAHFASTLPQYTLSVTNDGHGTTSPNGFLTTQYNPQTLAASPGAGYAFDQWSGDVTGLANGIYSAQNSVVMDNNKVIQRYEPQPLSRLDWSQETIDAIHEGMDSVVNGSRGTGHSVRLPNIRVGGKTGSAENPHGKTHALFVCAAPMDAPEIAVGVIVENGGHGGSTAGPIAAAILRTYFKKTGRLPKDVVTKVVDMAPSNER